MSLTLSKILKAAGTVFGVMAVLLAASVVLARQAVDEDRDAVSQQARYKELGLDLNRASDLLTDQARTYAVTGQKQHLDAYWREIDTTKTRDRAVAELKRLDASDAELALVEEAKQNSDGLVKTESRSQRLVLEATGVAEAQMPPAIAATQLSAADKALSPEAKMQTAARIMFDQAYEDDKAKIAAPMERFETLLNGRAEAASADARGAVSRWMTILLVLAVAFPLALGAVGWLVYRQIIVPVSGYVRALRERDSSDLGFALQADGVAELRVLATEFNEQFQANEKITERLLGDLTGIIGEVRATASTVTEASQQMATSSEEAGRAVGEIANAVTEVARGAEMQVRTIESARRATEEMTSASAQSADNAQQTAQAAQAALEMAREGATAVAQATTAMESVREASAGTTTAIRGLGAKSQQIGGIVDTITGIAEQTNLLALNAAIEAARAGDQGRGFAVVADEVRKLAEESQGAASSIAVLIAEIQAETTKAVDVVESGAQRTTDGAATVEHARESFERIAASVSEMHDRVAQIAAAIQQIAASSQGVQQNMSEVAAVAEQSSASAEEVSASTEQTSASTQQIAASAQDLAITAQGLKDLVENIKVSA